MTSNKQLWTDPVARARMGGQDVETRLETLEAFMQQSLARNIAAQSNAELTLDPGRQNVSFPYAANGRLFLSANGGQIPAGIYVNPSNETLIFYLPWKGNQVGIFDGTQWNPLTIPVAVLGTALQFPLTQTQTGTISNGLATVTGLSDTTQLLTGFEVSGTNIPTGLTIQSVDSASQITMTGNATGSGSITVTFKVPNNCSLHIFGIDSGGGVLALRATMAYNTPTYTITNATNATPIVITTSANYAFGTGNLVTQQFVGGNTAANGTFRVVSTGLTTYQLLNLDGTNVAGSGAYTSGGQVRQVDDTTAYAALGLQDNVYVKSGDSTWRYLGTIRTNTNSGQSNDSPTTRFIYNYYNRVRKVLQINEASGVASWTYNSATWRLSHNDARNRVEWILGIMEDAVDVYLRERTAATAAGATPSLAVMYNVPSVTTPSLAFFAESGSATANVQSMMTAHIIYAANNAPGSNAGNYNYVQAFESSQAALNATFFGNPNYEMSGQVWL